MIGERLQELRNDKGLTQKELAEAVAVSQYTISSYETNRSEPNHEITVRIAQFFDVSSDYLMGLIDEPLPLNGRDKDLLRLPRNLTGEEKQDIKKYIAYVVAKRR